MPNYNFLFHTFFRSTYFVGCVFVSLTAVRISRSVYFFNLLSTNIFSVLKCLFRVVEFITILLRSKSKMF